MTEGMMSPERQGWFAGVKDKLRKSFTVEGSKEKFYQKNADLISKATVSLSPEDKQAAFAAIEQDALTSAKIDVATHWGAVVLGAATAGLGGALLNDNLRGKIGDMGPMGKKMENFGQKAKDGLVRIIGRFKIGNFRFEGRGSALPINRDIDKAQRKLDAALHGRKVNGQQVAELRRNLAALKRQAEAGKFARIDAQADKFGEAIRANRKEVRAVQKLAERTQIANAEKNKGLRYQKKLIEWARDEIKTGNIAKTYKIKEGK